MGLVEREALDFRSLVVLAYWVQDMFVWVDTIDQLDDQF